MALSLATITANLGTTACSDQLDGNMSQEDAATVEQAAFVNFAGGFVPGKDLDGTPLRICNALHQGDAVARHPGKMRDGSDACRFAWGTGVESRGAFASVELTYIPSSAPDIWNRTVALGYESNGTERLYTCLAEVDGVTYAGKTSPALGSCRIARGELEVATATFQLIGDYAADSEAPPVTKAAKSSSLAWSAIRVYNANVKSGKRYCLARRIDNNRTSEHPGWEQDGVCNYAYGSGAQHESTNFSYLIPRYSTPGSTFFKAGNEADGSPLGACRVEHPTGTGSYQLGKYMPTLNECHFEYADKRQVYTTGFRVLR